MKRENSEKLQQIIKLIHEKKTNREIKVELTPMFGNLGDSTIRWARTVDKREETLQRGRKRKISEEIDDNSRQTIKQGPAGRTNQDIKAVIDDELKKKREANNLNPYSIPSVSASTYYRAIRESHQKSKRMRLVVPLREKLLWRICIAPFLTLQ